jgi:K+-sensing histidine kinase KdpD
LPSTSSLPPIHAFTLQDSSNWFALGVFLVTAVVVSDLAARSRALRPHRCPGAGREQSRLHAERAATDPTLAEEGQLARTLEAVA